MKTFIFILFTVISFSSFSQEENKLVPLPVGEINILTTSCTALEITLYEGTSTISMTGINNTKFLAAGLDSIAPTELNTKNNAYIMIIVNDDFYMDAELSFGEKKYVIFKKDEKTYYNTLNEQGERFFKQILEE